MKAQFTNKAIVSFMLWLDHEILSKGEAYTNTSSYFYPQATQDFSGLYTYASPFKQFVADVSITGANVPTGIYLDGTFLPVGQSGLSGIDYNNGRVFFSSQITGTNRISGNFAVKDVNVCLTELTEEAILFETKYALRPRTHQTATGIAPDAITYPVMFLKYNGGQSTEFAMGGMEQTESMIRATVMGDSQFLIDAIDSICKDATRKCISIFDEADMPFNIIGGLKAGVYNYTGIARLKTPSSYMDLSSVDSVSYNGIVSAEIKNMNPAVYPLTVDFKVDKIRYPRI